MNTRAVYTRWLNENRRTLIGWSIGATITPLLYLSLWNSMSTLLTEKMELLPKQFVAAMGLQNVAGAAGYTQTTVYQLLGLLIVLICAISQGAKAIGGDEEAGTLELSLARAVTRTQLLLARLGAVVTIVFVAGSALGAMVLVQNSLQSLGIAVTNILAVTTSFLALALFHALVAFTAGAVSGRKGTATAIATAIAVVGYLLNNLGANIATWMPKLSPFNWAFGNEPIVNGWNGPGLGLLIGGIVLCSGIAIFGFMRADIRN